MKNILFVVVLAGCIVGCMEPKTSKYSETQMAEILSEMRIAKSTSDRFSLSQKDSIRTFLEQEVYDIYGLDSLEYGIILGTLIDDSELFFRVEKVVQDRLDSMKTIYDIQ